jgi:predicted NBD/HSP70 family sugar kinase
VLERLGHDIGLGVATLASVLDPELVVLGGYFVPLAGLVLEPARRALDARLASAAQRRPDLRVSTLDSRAAAIGAAEQSFADFLAGTAGLPA